MASIWSGLARLGKGTEGEGLITQFFSLKLMGPILLLFSGAMFLSLAGGPIGRTASAAANAYTGFFGRQEGWDAQLERWGALPISGGLAVVGCTGILAGILNRSLFLVALSLILTSICGFAFAANLQMLGITDGPFPSIPGNLG